MTDRLRTRLLVSVRSADEARLALAAGVDLIDVKEPSHGPLGRATSETIAEVVTAVDGRLAVSAALGELLEVTPAEPASLPSGLSFAKLGLAGCSEQADWPAMWQAAMQALGTSGPSNVAVVYADWQAAKAPAPAEVLRQAKRLGCHAVLVDTYDKAGGGLLECWGWQELKDFVAAVREEKLMIVLAGSLAANTIERVLPLAPDYVAVRGAACAGSRHGALDPASVRSLVVQLAERQSAAGCAR
jgi:uncharacterized protein (UPF0264 family)